MVLLNTNNFKNDVTDSMMETLTGTTTSGQSGPGNNEGVFHTPQNLCLIKFSLVS